MSVDSRPVPLAPGTPGMAVAGVRQRGIALAIVVWFIAGMSLLVAGIVSHARMDTRMAQLHVARAKAVAAGDGAIQLMMVEVATGRVKPVSGQSLPVRAYKVGELEVNVSLVPTSGLIDLNRASAETLVALFIVAAQLEPAQAQYLADNVVKWRSPASAASGSSRRTSRFVVMEDLLRVDGIGRTLLDAIRGYVVVGMPSSKGTDWSLAPELLLAVLKKTDPDKADAVLRHRSDLEEFSRKTAADSAGGDGSLVTRGSYRLDARVRYGDQIWLRRQWVSMGSTLLSLLPWRTVRIEAPRVVEKRVIDR